MARGAIPLPLESARCVVNEVIIVLQAEHRMAHLLLKVRLF